jgi:hypothetical protein
MWDIPNASHSLADDGHIPRQRPVPDLRRRPPRPRGLGTEHTYMSAPPSKHLTAQSPDGARSAAQWAVGPRESLHRELPRESRVLETARWPPRQDIPRGHPRRPPRPPGIRPSRDARPHRRAVEGPRCRGHGRAPLRSWECCAAPRGSTGRRQCPYDQARPASPLTGPRGGGACLSR